MGHRPPGDEQRRRPISAVGPGKANGRRGHQMAERAELDPHFGNSKLRCSRPRELCPWGVTERDVLWTSRASAGFHRCLLVRELSYRVRAFAAMARRSPRHLMLAGNKLNASAKAPGET